VTRKRGSASVSAIISSYETPRAAHLVPAGFLLAHEGELVAGAGAASFGFSSSFDASTEVEARSADAIIII